MRVITIIVMVALVAIVAYLAIRLAIARCTLEEAAEAKREAQFIHEINLSIDAALIQSLQSQHMRTLIEFGETMSAYLTLQAEHAQLKKDHAFLWERATDMWQEYEADIDTIAVAVEEQTGFQLGAIIGEFAASLPEIADDDGPIPYDLIPKDCEA
jgi:hypothetical protein